MSYLYLLKYNNYYNRIVKLEGNLTSSYDEFKLVNSQNNLNYIQGVNFIPNDGVHTEQVINWSGDNPDYLIVSDDGTNVTSRWFIIDSVRLRNGQFKLQLRRDVIADNYDEVVVSPVYIEKATVDESDSAIFNREDLQVSQIKTAEKLIGSTTQDFPCIVGYVERKPYDDTEEQDTSITIPIGVQVPDFNYRPLSNSVYRRYYPETGVGISVVNPEDTNIAFISGTHKVFPDVFTFNNSYGGLQAFYSGDWYNHPYYLEPGAYSDQDDNYMDDDDKGALWTFRNYISDHRNEIDSLATSYISNYDDRDIYALFNGKVVKEGDEYYRIDVTVNIQWERFLIGGTSALGSLLSHWRGSSKPINYYCNIFSDVVTYNVTYTHIGSHIQTNWSLTFPKSRSRTTCQDAIYDLFVLPFSDDISMEVNSSQSITSNKEKSMQIALSIARKLGSRLYDLQLLPYCPLPDVYINSTNKVIYSAPKNEIKDGGGNTSYCLYWSERSKFTRNFNYNINISNIKESNCLDLYRLVSPNGNGIFEFSPAMNRGVDYFKIDCLYQPSNPYIHVAPNFKAQYGQDFNDKRGLICQGDFSLPYVLDKWVEYQNNNKYYQAIFDRQIDNMEFNNNWSLAESIVGAVSGTASGAVGGATAGALMGGIGGAAIGGAIGGVASLAGGITDIAKTVSSQKENIDYTKDLFNYNLKTIQAMPTSISKLSILDPNYKVLPYLERYTCTEIERNAFRNKIKYNGMKVGRIATINEFIKEEPSYIKGQLIRLEDSNNDFHEVNAIAEELNKGVFI